MKKPIAEREQVVHSLVKGELNRHEAAVLLKCSVRTINRYVVAYLVYQRAGLVDHRHSNHHKLTSQDQDRIVALKKLDPWRSPRNIRDCLNLPVHPATVWRILKSHGLHRPNLKRVKAIVRFEASAPNDLWQTDIMGKIDFTYLGVLYLIGTLDDYSRFVPQARWFHTQGKMNVFQVWYESMANWGLPTSMLQDEGSQYKARTKFGMADYQWYASQLQINLIWAKSAQCKGKIERFWGFVQDDFVPSVLKAKSLDEVNGQWRQWLAWYNYKFRSPYFDHETHAARYRPSQRKVKRVVLENLLLIEERRKVTRESTISLYGKHYYVPPGYIGCRIWVKIKGNKVLMEANGKVFHSTRIRLN